jgi:hypothetical protein
VSASRLAVDFTIYHLENLGLIDRTEDNEVDVPWTIVEDSLQLAA